MPARAAAKGLQLDRNALLLFFTGGSVANDFLHHLLSETVLEGFGDRRCGRLRQMMGPVQDLRWQGIGR